MVPAIPAAELSESAGGVWANPKGFRCVMTSFDRLIETRWAYAVLAGLAGWGAMLLRGSSRAAHADDRRPEVARGSDESDDTGDGEPRGSR